MASLQQLVKALEKKKATPDKHKTAADTKDQTVQRETMGAGFAFGGRAKAKRLKKGG